MKQESFVSNYTIAQYKLNVARCNEEKIENVISLNCDIRLKSFTKIEEMNSKFKS